MIIFNDSPKTTKQKTVVVFGCGRGGTSAIAGALRILGVQMPADTHPLKHESSPIVYKNGAVDAVGTAKNIQKMNEKHSVWGWKSPGDIFSVSFFSGLLRNPHYIVITRSMSDVIASAAKHDAIDPKVLATDVGVVFAEIGRFLLLNIHPTVSLSYEGLIKDPEKTLRDLAAWLGLKVSDETLASAVEFIAGGGSKYKPVDEHSGEFSSDELKGDIEAAHARNYTSCTKVMEDSEAAYVNSCRDAENVLSHLRARVADALLTKAELGQHGPVIAKQALFMPMDQFKTLVGGESVDDVVAPVAGEAEAQNVKVEKAPVEARLFKLGFQLAWERYAAATSRREQLGKALDDASGRLAYLERVLARKALAREAAAPVQAESPAEVAPAVQE